MLSLVRSLGPLPGCFFFFFWVLGLSHPWLYDADNRAANKIRKRLLCLFPVWNNERQWRGNRQSCTRPSALVFFLVFSKSKLKQDRSQLQGRKSQAEIGYAKFAKFASFFFLTKNAWSFWAKRLDEKNKIGKRVEGQMAKLESICLGNGKNGCRARPATSTTPTKTPKQPLQQLTADQISKLQLRWHPYALKEYRITVSCSDSWADTPWAKWLEPNGLSQSYGPPANRVAKELQDSLHQPASRTRRPPTPPPTTARAAPKPKRTSISAAHRYSKLWLINNRRPHSHPCYIHVAHRHSSLRHIHIPFHWTRERGPKKKKLSWLTL